VKAKIPLIFLLLLSCQGPWSYYPEERENYQGIWTYAYVISGRPVENVCFDKMHSLTEVRMPGFAFYESASVTITGSFSGKDTSFFLEPKTANLANMPNCFVGPKDLLAESGKDYKIGISIAWDSAGKKTVSNFYAETYIPREFKVQRAYDLFRQRYNSGDTVLYLPPPMDLQSNYFIPKYSEDVGGVLVSIVYGKDVYWGENSLDRVVNQFTEANDTARHAFFGDRRQMYVARNQRIAGSNKDIDSIPIVAMSMPAIGSAKLLFYATTPEYIKYDDTYLDGNDDSRVKAIYNIHGGAGIFAGMLVDTFEVNLKTLPNVKIYPYAASQENYCFRRDRGYDEEYWKTRRQCVEIWDMLIWTEILCGDNMECSVYDYLPLLWYNIPQDKLKTILNATDLITWCEHRNFPIDIYPLCGTALVYYSKTGKISAILDREVKKWCEGHKDNAECLFSVP